MIFEPLPVAVTWRKLSECVRYACQTVLEIATFDTRELLARLVQSVSRFDREFNGTSNCIRQLGYRIVCFATSQEDCRLVARPEPVRARLAFDPNALSVAGESFHDEFQ